MSLMQPFLGPIWKSSSQVSPGQDNPCVVTPLGDPGLAALGHSRMERKALLRWPVGGPENAWRPIDNYLPRADVPLFCASRWMC